MEMTDNEARLLTQVADVIEEADILRRKLEISEKINRNLRSKAEPNPIVPDYSGLEKIEPISGIIIESRWSPPSPSEFTAKLNEVIEKVNRIMEVMNRR